MFVWSVHLRPGSSHLTDETAWQPGPAVVMHPWHDVRIDAERITESFPVVIEVPMGSRNKYEGDKATGLLRLDRVLYGALYYPANYGFVPRTYAHDADPLDVLVFGQEAVQALTIVDVRLIGVIEMRDQDKSDDKLLAV